MSAITLLYVQVTTKPALLGCFVHFVVFVTHCLRSSVLCRGFLTLLLGLDAFQLQALSKSLVTTAQAAYSLQCLWMYSLLLRSIRQA